MDKNETDSQNKLSAIPSSTVRAIRLTEHRTSERAWALSERQLVRKLDTRLLPMVVIIYIMNFIDRNNVTNARLKDVQYATVIAILYASYCPFQIPSNMLLNYISRPSLYIGSCVVLWGLCSTLTGITTNASSIFACRVLIGIPEAAFYPGTFYLLSRWYTKKELAFRSAFLSSGVLIANAFGSLMAAGILSDMEGKRGVRAWRWLFYIEGAITIIVGLSSILLLPDYPHNTRWMSVEERQLAQARLSEDAGEADMDNAGDSPFKGLKMALRDPLVPVFAIMTCAQLLGLSYSNFFPSLTGTLGFSTTLTLVLAAPPWITAAIISCINAWHADKTGERFFHIAGWWWCVISGFIIALSTMEIPARYVAIFLMACGQSAYPLTLVWVSNSVPRPPAKRAAAIAIVNGIGNLGNLIGSYTWKPKWSPGYHNSMGISLAFLIVSTYLAFLIRQTLRLKNKKLDDDEDVALRDADRARVEEAARIEGLTFEQAMERRKGYRYLY